MTSFDARLYICLARVFFRHALSQRATIFRGPALYWLARTFDDSKIAVGICVE